MPGALAAMLPKPDGSLASRDFADLIQSLYASAWTGTLTLTQGGIGKSVFVDAGRLIFASSSSADDRLGEMLLGRGQLTYRQFTEAGRVLSPGRRLGAVLVEQGVLAPKDLVRAVVEHTQEIIYSLFRWTEGRYRLQNGHEASAEVITLRMSTPAVVIEGIRRIESWSRIARAIGGIEARYRRIEGYESLISEAGLSAEVLTLLTDLDEERSVGEICDGSVLPDMDVCRFLWGYRVIGALTRVDAVVEGPRAGEDDGLGSVLAAGLA